MIDGVGLRSPRLERNQRAAAGRRPGGEPADVVTIHGDGRRRRATERRSRTSSAAAFRMRATHWSTRPSSASRPARRWPTAVVRYRVGGRAGRSRAPVQRREARLPYGFVMRELRVVPAIAVTVVARHRRRADRSADEEGSDIGRSAEQSRRGSKGEVTLRLPQGWTCAARARAVRVSRARASGDLHVCGEHSRRWPIARIRSKPWRRATDVNTARATRRSSIATSRRATCIDRR